MLLNNLLPASYRNTRFFVNEETIKVSGFIKQENLTAGLNKYRTLTVTGNKPIEATLDVYFGGNNAVLEAKRFIKFSETNEVGNLQLPVLGIYKNIAVAEAMDLSASTTEVGIVRVKVRFVEVLDKKITKNLFTDLQDLIAEADRIIADIYDNLYIFTEVTTAIYSVKGTINRLLTATNLPALAVKDLQSALSVKSFLNNTLKELKKQPLSIISLALGFMPLSPATNNINANKVRILNILKQTFSVTTTIAFAEATTEANYNSKEQIQTQLNEFLALNDTLVKQDCLACVNSELFVITSSIIQISMEILESKQDSLPTEYEVDLIEKGGMSSIFINYYSNTELDFIEAQQFNIYNMQGKIKCLKF